MIQNMIGIDCSYSKIKDVVSSRLLSWNYINETNFYRVFCVDVAALFIYTAIVAKGTADASDFETNYEPSATNYTLMEDGIADIVSSGFDLLGRDENRAHAIKTKPQFHRPGLTFRPEGLWFLMSKATAYVPGTDHSDLKFSTKVNGAHNIADTAITVDSVRGFAENQAVTFDKGGANEETKTIRSVDAANLQITLTAGLTNAQVDNATVEMPRIKVSYSSSTKITTVDIIFAGQKSDNLLAGTDIQEGSAFGAFNDLDGCKARMIVPYWTGASFMEVNGPFMSGGEDNDDEIFVLGTETKIVIDAKESASAIDPDYVLRMWFKSREPATPTEKKIRITFGVWRA